MRKAIFLFMPLALVANCKAAPEQAVSPPAAMQVEKSAAPTNAEFQAAKPGDPLSPFEKDGSVKSSFPPGVVIRLNAIVAGSKDAIDSFDKLRPRLQAAAQSAKSAPGNAKALDDVRSILTELDALQSQASTAKAALSEEGTQLLKGGKYYDAAIFSGMAVFVSKVDDEIADERKAVIAALPK